MTIEEIQKRLDALATAMIGKGLVAPEAVVTIASGGRLYVHLNWIGQGSSKKEYKFFYKGCIKDAIDAADAWVSALPTAETITMTTYLGKLADAVDYGHANGIPAEYVDPVRVTQKAMSDNLLEAQK